MKLIVRLKGGLGNQLFCYAAARRLALKNDMELIIDDITGFIRDYQYKNNYVLDCFNIIVRKATNLERLEPFERIRRGIRKKFQGLKKFEDRNYIEQEFDDFDERILYLAPKKNIYFDGFWQSEKYFKDIEDTIRNDLQMLPPKDELNLSIAKKIRTKQSVAIHIRWFDQNNNNSNANVQSNYYQQALDKMESLLDKPYYFIFSDNPEKAKERKLPDGRFEFINHNNTSGNAIWDFWLMRQCNHFIIANSTFSWWAAWLSNNEKKIVIYPKLPEKKKHQWNWDYDGQMPTSWFPIELK